jgi:ribonuclease HI
LPAIDVYIDGGCLGNRGSGGWAALIYQKPKPLEISGHEKDTTNQRTELRAAIEGLKYLTDPSQVKLHSDSAYLTNGMKRQWYLKRQQNGWITSKKKTSREPGPLERVDQDFWASPYRLGQSKGSFKGSGQ